MCSDKKKLAPWAQLPRAAVARAFAFLKVAENWCSAVDAAAVGGVLAKLGGAGFLAGMQSGGLVALGAGR